jgi:hypothetical protein
VCHRLISSNDSSQLLARLSRLLCGKVPGQIHSIVPQKLYAGEHEPKRLNKDHHRHSVNIQAKMTDANEDSEGNGDDATVDRNAAVQSAVS